MSDCLHRDLRRRAIEYMQAHPCDCEKELSTCVSVEEVVEALAEVIGDQLASEGSWAHRDYFLRHIDERFRSRSQFMRKEQQGGISTTPASARELAPPRRPDIWIGTPEDISEGIEGGHLGKIGAIAMQIGSRGHLTRQEPSRMATQWKKMIERNPRAVILGISIGGYDDDPCELWEIDEVVRYVRRWARLAGLDNITTAQRLFEKDAADSLAFLRACGVFAA